MWKIFAFAFLQILIIAYGSPAPIIDEAPTNSTKELFLKKNSHAYSTASKCECYQYNCGCCVFMDVPKLHLNDTGCINMTYLPEDYGLTVTATIDKWALFNETISARSPPPICFGEDYLPVGGLICLKFYDLNVTRTWFHACMQIYAQVHHIHVAKYDLGCFDIGKKSLNVHFNKHNGSKFVYIPKPFYKVK